MKDKIDALKYFAASANVLNTMSGGIVEPLVRSHKLPDSHSLDIKVPGVSQEAIKVEIHNNLLTVSHRMEISMGNATAQIPRIVYNKTIPFFIDVERITANFENNQLHINMPFNERANGYHRKVKIQQ